MNIIKKLLKPLFLIIVAFVIIFPRFYQLGSTPHGLHIDEVSFAADAKSLAETGRDTWDRHAVPHGAEPGGGGDHDAAAQQGEIPGLLAIDQPHPDRAEDELEQVIRTALAPTPAERFASAAELAG